MSVLLVGVRDLWIATKLAVARDGFLCRMSNFFVIVCTLLVAGVLGKDGSAILYVQFHCWILSSLLTSVSLLFYSIVTFKRSSMCQAQKLWRHISCHGRRTRLWVTHTSTCWLLPPQTDSSLQGSATTDCHCCCCSWWQLQWQQYHQWWSSQCGRDTLGCNLETGEQGCGLKWYQGVQHLYRLLFGQRELCQQTQPWLQPERV